MRITVVNKYKEPNHIYCGRGSPVGNPFYMDTEKERDHVCNLYEDWFKKEMALKPTKLTEFVDNLVLLASMGNINLGCFCAPKRCHCDTIKQYIEEQLNVNKTT